MEEILTIVIDFVAAWNRVMNLYRFDLAKPSRGIGSESAKSARSYNSVPKSRYLWYLSELI